MVSLLQILKEAVDGPKAIVLAGGAGAGKSYIAKNILGDLKDGKFKPKGSSQEFLYLNPDDIVEKKGVSLGAAMGEFNQIFQDTTEKNQNLIWDTTGTNVKNTLGKLQDYNKFMVMVYTHPIVSILQNKKRDRRLPIEAVLKTWDSVYGNIPEYKKILGDNFNILQNNIPGYEKDIKEFNQAVQGGKESLKKYLSDLVGQDPEGFKSSFSKPFEFETKEIEASFEETLPQTSYSDKDEDILKQIQREYEKEYKKRGEDPGKDILEKKIKSVRNTKARNEKNYNENIEGIVSKLSSPEFKQFIEPNTPEEVQQKLKAFAS